MQQKTPLHALWQRNSEDLTLPHREKLKIEGQIGDVFFHRFVILTSSGEKVLADIGPKGAAAFSLETGLHVVAEGERKPSELKVDRIARKGEPALTIEHKKKHEHGPHDHVEPAAATRAVLHAGIEPIGEPRRKPKHFEVLGRRSGRLIECHVEFDGHIRKEKPVEPFEHKWSSELGRIA